MPQPDAKPGDLVSDGSYLIPQRISLEGLSVAPRIQEAPLPPPDPAIPAVYRSNAFRAERAERNRLTLQLAAQKASHLALRELVNRMTDPKEEKTQDVIGVAKLGLPKEVGDTNVTIADKALIIKVVRE
jgi:hypothetical protein